MGGATTPKRCPTRYRRGCSSGLPCSGACSRRCVPPPSAADDLAPGFRGKPPGESDGEVKGLTLLTKVDKR
jgi:hypothetical protein